LAVLGTLALLLPASSASAAPPTLLTVDYTASTTELQVTWSLPPGVESAVIEANANPSLDSDGYFLYGPNNGVYGYPAIVFDVPDSTDTRWDHLIDEQPPGTYYVHVAGFDSTCDTCPVREWTSLGTFTVPEPAPPPPPPPPPVKKTYMPNCTGKPLYRPKKVIVACGDGNVWLSKVHWKGWTRTVASATAVFHWNDCKPYCAAGHFHARAGAHVRLYRVNLCKSKGFRQFTRMRLTPPRTTHFKVDTQPLSCTFR
jgi:hypothetical protein